MSCLAAPGTPVTSPGGHVHVAGNVRGGGGGQRAGVIKPRILKGNSTGMHMVRSTNPTAAVRAKLIK